jgi:hypothetical protein
MSMLPILGVRQVVEFLKAIAVPRIFDAVNRIRLNEEFKTNEGTGETNS